MKKKQRKIVGDKEKERERGRERKREQERERKTERKREKEREKKKREREREKDRELTCKHGEKRRKLLKIVDYLTYVENCVFLADF